MSRVKKITWKEMVDNLYKHNEIGDTNRKGADPNPIYGVVVYKESNWKQKYSLAARSYVISSDNKFFIPDQIGSSIFANSLDMSDIGVRLDLYRDWQVDYCYMLKGKENSNGKE